MEPSTIINPPEMDMTPKRGGFWRQLGMLVLGTTVSLVLTFGTAWIIEKQQRAKDRRLTALMVMSNIEAFAQQLDSLYAQMDEADSASTWLLTRPGEKLELMPGDQLVAIISTAFVPDLITYDKSTENIFSNNIETWKNMGNVHFIDQVGQCFSAMHSIEEYWDKWTTGINETCADISNHPDQYEGSSNNSKILCNDKMRHYIGSIHTMRGWLSYTAATMRYHNRRNMASIGITEKAVLDYTNARDMEEGNQEVEPNPSDFYTAPLDPANLTSMQRYDARIEELKR